VASTGFSGSYLIGKWAETFEAAGGTTTLWDISGAPSSVILKNYNNWAQSFDQMAITAKTSGTVAFSWNYVLDAGAPPANFPAGYLVNGTFTQLSSNSGAVNQNGTTSFTVNAGDTFAFRNGVTVNSGFHHLAFTISSFSAPDCQ
jgi:hypothetical protein